jgi:amino acid adenylation domain-containing protein
MSVSVYRKLTKLGIRFSSQENKLLWEAPRGVVTPTILDELKNHKDSLLELLNIGPAERSRALRSSYAQERLWFLAQIGYSRLYHIPMMFLITGKPDPQALQSSLDRIAARHESVRTGFCQVNGEVIQIIDAGARVELETSDLTRLKPEQRKIETQALVHDFTQRNFDLEKPPLVRAMLIRTEDDRYIFAICMHHIISDGWSMGILIRELTECYAASTQGREPKLDSLKVQYADYAAWQHRVLTVERLAPELEYWRNRLRGLQDLNLAADFARPGKMSGAGGRVRISVDAGEAERWQTACRRSQVTLYTLFLSGVYSLLRKYSRQTDICLGTLAANRNHSEIENIIGFFVNTLVVRFTAGRVKARELLAMTRNEIAEAQDHQNVPFEKIMEAAEVKRDLASNPIFQVAVNYVNTHAQKLTLGDCRVEDIEPPEDGAKFDLTFALADRPDGSLGVTIEYSRDLYERDTIERMGGHLLRVVAGLVDGPEEAIDELELMSKEEKNQILEEWNRTELAYENRCLHEWVEEEAKKSKEKLAVRWRGGKLSYGELEERSRRVALYLQRAGVGPERLVALCMDRSGWMVVGMLGILRAGGGYVPVDPAYPKERVRYMLKQSGAKMVMTERGMSEKVREMVEGMGGEVKVIELDEKWGEIAKEEGELKREVKPKNVAYVFYTSGSTGQPKGVVVEHGNAVAFLEWVKREFGEEEMKRVLATTSLSFDLSIFEVWGPLVIGGEVVVLRDALELGEGALKEEWMEGEQVSLINTVPSAISELLKIGAVPKELKLVNMGGEALGWKVAEQINEYGVEKLRNLYGPTEATTYATWLQVKAGKERRPSVGRPLGNTRIYILDESLRPVPVGVMGEIYIGGHGVTRGYLGRPELTAERFVPDPFGKEEGARLYGTGDLGRYGKDAEIEYAGRADQQVKVRGYRIECGEIESVMQEQAGVEGAAVIAKNINDSPQLIAYYVAGPQTPELAELKTRLSSKLPDYMVPALFIAVPELPLTSNGKIDRRNLMAREISLGNREYVAPRNDQESLAAQCWSEVLGVEQVGIRDSFFDLGGHSLLVIQVVNKMNLAGIQCSFRDFYDHLTIESLMDHLGHSRAQQAVDAPPAQESFPLLPVQLQAIEAGFQAGKSFIKLSPTFIDLAENVNESALVQALDAWHKQTIFSVRFKKDDAGWSQFYQTSSAYDYCHILEFNLDETATGEELVQQVVKICYQVESAIDIYAGPTMLIVLFRKRGRIRHLLWVIDHLLVDNISFFMLFTNLKLAYKQIVEKKAVWFPVDTIHGRWAAHLAEQAHQAALLQEVGFWKSHFPVPVLQTEINNHVQQGQIELEYRVRLVDRNISQKAIAFLIQQGLSFEESCLGQFLWAFKNSFSDDPVLLCMVSGGRDSQIEGIDLSQGMGWFSTSYPVKFNLNAPCEHLEFLRGIVRQHNRYSEIKEHYGALRYLNQEAGKELGKVEDWTSSIVFNCMGEVTTPSGKDDVVRLSGTCLQVHIAFDQQERQNRRQAPIDQGQAAGSPLRRVFFSLSDGAIQIVFAFCKEKIDSQAVEKLLQAIEQSFAGLVS